jgi:hypothetical protein
MKDNRLEVCKSVIKELYSDSAGLRIIMERISKFIDDQILNIDNDTFSRLNAFPSFNKEEEEYKAEYKSLSDVINKLNLNKDSVLSFIHVLGGLEGITLLSYRPLDKNEDIISPYSLSDIIPIIKAVNNPVIFCQGKLYRAFKNEILKKLEGRKIYIFMENSFITSFNLITKEFSSSKYIIIPEQEYDILAICNSNHTLLQIVMKGLENDIKEKLTIEDIQPANFIETTQFNYQEIRKITRALFNRCNWAINNKSFGFK